MNGWYELTNDLETDVQPMDEVTLSRIQKRALSAMPRRKKPLRVIAAIVAILVLTACGYVAATQFSQWFWNKAADPKAPEASEDLLASMGTVIEQSQTADGLTMTLHGALWDGSTMLLSLTLEGENLPEVAWSHMQSEDSWLRSSRDQTRKYLKTSFPYMTDEELDDYLEKYWQNSQYWFRPNSITYLQNRQTTFPALQIETSVPYSGDTQELVLHLENLELPYREGSESLIKTIRGPFEFTFTVEQKKVELVYFGELDIEPVEGFPIRATKVSVSPFQVSVGYTGLEKMELDANGDPVWENGFELSLEALRVDGEEVTGFASGQSGSRSCGPDGSWSGSVSRGPFARVITPASVEAVKINGIWVELSGFTLMETPEA